MIINTEQIEHTIKKHTAYSLAQKIGVNRANLNNYKNGRYSVDNMTIALASKIQNYYNEEMENMKTFTVNKRKESVEKIASALNNCDMLLGFEIEDRVNSLVLHVQTNELVIEYTEVEPENMKTFLNDLKSIVNNKDDIDELLEEIQYIINN